MDLYSPVQNLIQKYGLPRNHVAILHYSETYLWMTIAFLDHFIHMKWRAIGCHLYWETTFVGWSL